MHIAASPMDYRAIPLQKRNKKGEFHGNRLRAAHVIGLLLEALLSMMFNPARGCLPKNIKKMTVQDVPEQVDCNDVLAPGSRLPKTVTVQAQPKDREFSLNIFRSLLSKLQGRPLYLQVHAVDHKCSSARLAGSHDLLVSPFPGMESRLSACMYSLELRCREVGERLPKTFDWQKTLEEEADPLLDAELKKDPESLQGRLLIFVELSKPCHSGTFHLHGSLREAGREKWTDVFGWAGFKRKRDDASSSASVAPVGSSTPPRPKRSRAAEWQDKAGRLKASNGWVVLAHFLRQCSSLPVGQSLRFVEGERPCRWTSATGGKPRKGTDWKYMKVAGRGGGAGDGVVHCRLDFLEHVFMTQLKS